MRRTPALNSLGPSDRLEGAVPTPSSPTAIVTSGTTYDPGDCANSHEIRELRSPGRESFQHLEQRILAVIGRIFPSCRNRKQAERDRSPGDALGRLALESFSQPGWGWVTCSESDEWVTPRNMNARLLGTRLYIIFGIAACFSATVAGSAYAEIQEPPSLQRFTSGGHVLGFDETGYFASNGTYALRVRFEGASGSSGSVVGTSPGPGTSGATASAVPEFEGISYEDVWPGIGVEYDAPKSGIARSTWTVAPGADPKTIQLRYNRPVALTGNGSLQIGFETGTMTESAPIAWQDVDLSLIHI